MYNTPEELRLEIEALKARIRVLEDAPISHPALTYPKPFPQRPQTGDPLPYPWETTCGIAFNAKTFGESGVRK